MAQKDPPPPWQQIEEQAYHAYREWPIWLVLRARELASRLTPPPSAPTTAAHRQRERKSSKEQPT
jgi:hypothetical protein